MPIQSLTMGHVLLAAPPIARFRLVEAVQRGLLQRGHQVSVLVTDPVTRRCFEAQGLAAQELRGRRGACPVPLKIPLGYWC